VGVGAEGREKESQGTADVRIADDGYAANDVKCSVVYCTGLSLSSRVVCGNCIIASALREALWYKKSV